MYNLTTEIPNEKSVNDSSDTLAVFLVISVISGLSNLKKRLRKEYFVMALLCLALPFASFLILDRV